MLDWPHAPVHRFGDAGVYFITAGTHLKQHLFRDRSALDALQSCLFELATDHRCELQAWSLFSNHYHLVAEADEGERIRQMLKRFHIETAREINARDHTRGRQVWFQCRDTQLTFERSWLARLRYTHENAVHHRLVRVATEYPWCSASWFERTAQRAFVETVSRVKIDRLVVGDDFELM
jgi:putative transposase